MTGERHSDGSTPDQVRDDVRAWLLANWDPEMALGAWRDTLADSGWGCPTWPIEWLGRGLPNELAAVVRTEFERVGAVGVAAGAGMNLVAPTLLRHGSDDVKARLLRPIVTGRDRWCQLFSEPGNGSDLAGLTTRAERDGDEWVVNGQKVWTTNAHMADYGMLLARTDWDVPKHRGITWFAFPMRQAGVEVRPLVQMNGRSSFNEVFLTDARVPHANVVGEVGGGWAVAQTTLAHERGLGAQRGDRASNPTGRTAIEAAAEAADYNRTYEWYPQRAGRPDLLVPQLRATGRADDALARQLVARTRTLAEVARWNVERAAAARAQGRSPGPEGSLAKLSGSNIARAGASVHAQLAGADAMLTGPTSVLDGIVAEIIVSVPGGSIAGGTDEIQHNIIGERSLGLPREPSLDADVPFREVRTNRRG